MTKEALMGAFLQAWRDQDREGLRVLAAPKWREAATKEAIDAAGLDGLTLMKVIEGVTFHKVDGVKANFMQDAVFTAKVDGPMGPETLRFKVRVVFEEGDWYYHPISALRRKALLS